MCALCTGSTHLEIKIRDLIFCPYAEMLFLTKLAKHFTNTNALLSLHRMGDYCCSSKAIVTQRAAEKECLHGI